jgi:hypothetical protein
LCVVLTVGELRRTVVSAIDQSLEVIASKDGLKLRHPSWVVGAFEFKKLREVWHECMIEKAGVFSVGGLEEDDVKELEFAIGWALALRSALIPWKFENSLLGCLPRVGV